LPTLERLNYKRKKIKRGVALEVWEV